MTANRNEASVIDPPPRDPFEFALDLVFGHEKGFVNNPNDSGGATNLGITIGILASYFGRPVMEDEVRGINKDLAKLIYKELFWEPMMLPQVSNAKVASILFDQAVLCGSPQAVMSAQRSLGLKHDGIVGPDTLAALNAAEESVFCFHFLAEQQAHYVDICVKYPNKLEFLKGWIRRTHQLFELIFVP